jgi:Wadjet protein JetD, C-terminal
MMDIDTLNDLQDLTGVGETAGAPPSNLSPEERAAFMEVKQNASRLEQEKIPLEYSIQAIEGGVRSTYFN